MNIRDKKLEHFTMDEMFSYCYGITTLIKKHVTELQGTAKKLELNDMEALGIVALCDLHQELLEEIEFRKSNNQEYKN